jgi:hypothetical protein
MINIQFNQSDYTVAGQGNESLQQYVHALLARQKALDLLETIQQQINQVWSVMRKLLNGPGAAVRAAKAVRAARAAQAAQAKSSYCLLEKRREECIAALQQAECRANAALQTMLIRPQPASPDFALSPRILSHAKPARRKLKNVFSGHN